MTKAAVIHVVSALEAAEPARPVWVNYEPYYWADRRARQVNPRGIAVHERTPLFLKSRQSIPVHDRFLRSLLAAPPGAHIVTKFIRGLGRMPRINAVMDPNLTIIVVRNLYSTLASVFSAYWDLLGQGLKHRSDRERFLIETQGLELPAFVGDLVGPDSKPNRIDLNAVYWYAMNYSALQQLAGPYIVVTEDGISTLWSRVAAALGLGPVQVRAELVSKAGHLLHDESHFNGHRELPRWGAYAAFTMAKSIVPSMNIYVPWQRTGSLVSTQSDFVSEAATTVNVAAAPGSSEYGGIGRLAVRECDYFDRMNDEIMSLTRREDEDMRSLIKTPEL